MGSYSLSKATAAAVLARDGLVCRCCEVRVYTTEEWSRLQRSRWREKYRELPILHFDHIVPRHHGGLTTEDNLQVLCDTCNAIKATRMPNRMIRESARTSETLDQLSDGAERMFWRLTTVADDYGRFEADPRVLLSMCFPLRAGRLKVEQVDKWLRELILVELVETYRADGKRYGVFKTWTKHQRIRAQHSKYPAPTPDNICQQMTADVPVVEVEVESRVLPKSNLPRAADAAPAMDVLEFLNRKTGKAFRAVEANLALIRARLSDGIEPWQLKAIVSRKVRDWQGTDQARYLRPATLFNKTKCEQYLGDLPANGDVPHAD